MGTLFEWTVETPTLKEKPKMQKRTIKAQLIRLADAMMKGGKKRVQCTGSLFELDTVEEQTKSGDWVERYRLGGSCALGAVYEGLFGTPPIDVENSRVNGGESHMHARLTKKLPVLELDLTEISQDPDAFFMTDSLQDTIIQKNDNGGLPRWKIARWIRGLAAKL